MYSLLQPEILFKHPIGSKVFRPFADQTSGYLLFSHR